MRNPTLTKAQSLMNFDYLFKTIVVGDGAVGKTAITVRFATGKFQENYKMTIGVDFSIKIIEMKGRKIKCQIWDTGGQEKFSSVRPLYYRGALGCVIVYDVTVRESFENLDRWFNEVISHCNIIPMILVGNKIDLPNREVSREEGEAYALRKGKELGIQMPYIESSAKTGDSIKKIFYELVTKMVGKAEESSRMD
ncbi:MAG: GTP-binding protein [Candidatus Heimdallarchaeota archaeon]|nr:GTP-binding protein [Candidatus Heimdallarchaeota archaeon]